jgi:hypothetical protein
VLELILVTPIIVLVMLAILEFGMLNITHGAVTHATTVGAREAGKLAPSGAIVLDEVVDEVNAVLAAVEILLGEAPGDGTYLIIEDGDDDPGDSSNWLTYGDPDLADDCAPPAEGTPTAGEVRVTLCIEFDATKLNGAPVIDAFSVCGFTFTGKRFQISTLVKKEVG